MSRLCAVVFVALLLFVGPVAVAEETSAIAVIDVQRLLSDSKAARTLQEQLLGEREKYQAEFSKHERELREADQKLAGDKPGLSPEAFEKRREELEGRILETNRLAKKRKRELDEGFNAALNELRGEIVKITARIADERGFGVVLTRQNVVIVAKERDITDEVLAELDKTLPKVTLKVSAK